MKCLELFSGGGGLAYGLGKAGFRHTGFVESDSWSCESLRKNFPANLVNQGDVREFDFEPLRGVSLVAGGPPCQPFSSGGKHKAADDSRDMFPAAIRAISELKPKVFLFENVKGLVRPSFAEYFDYIILRLAFPEITKKKSEDWRNHSERLRKIHNKPTNAPDYNVSYKLLNAADYGVPQVRERVFIVGFRSDLNKDWEFPAPTHSKHSLERSKYVSGEYWDRHGLDRDCVVSSTNQDLVQESIFQVKTRPWRTVRDAICHLPNPELKHDLLDHIFRAGAKSYPGHTGSDIDSPAKTLKAGVHGVPGGENMIRFDDNSLRWLTIREAKLLQTFPEEFFFAGPWSEAMRQIGNAVPVRLAEILGASIQKTLSRRLRRK